MNTGEVQHIVIVGGGTAGWMTAAALSKYIEKDFFKVTLIESEAIGTVGVGEATIPSIRSFNHRLGIDEGDFIKATSATFKLGIDFRNWGKIGDSYIHPFGDYRYDLGGQGIDFHHFWLKATYSGMSAAIEEYSLPVAMCRAEKFSFPVEDRASLRSTYNYAYHIDASAYAVYLRAYSQKKGVTREEGVITDVVLDENSGDINSVLVNGRHLKADFFIDCSGFRSLLLGKALKSKFDDWSRWLRCDAAVAGPTASTANPRPYTIAAAHAAGWQWNIPLQSREGNGFVYASEFLTKADAEEKFLTALQGQCLKSPLHVSFKAGKYKDSWVNNCVAIGLAAGFLEPLESSSIYLIQEGILRFLDCLPHNNNFEINRKCYNRVMQVEYERVRDFLVLHYKLTARNDSEFWNYCRNMEVPESLQEKISLFKSSGIISSYKQGLFQIPSWLTVYLGQGLFPDSYDPRLDVVSVDNINKALMDLNSEIKNQVMRMSSHSSFFTRLQNEVRYENA